MKALLLVALWSTIAACGRPPHTSEASDSVGPTITDRPAARRGNPPPPAVIVGAGDSLRTLDERSERGPGVTDPRGTQDGEGDDGEGEREVTAFGFLLVGSGLTLLGALTNRGRRSGARTTRAGQVCSIDRC